MQVIADQVDVICNQIATQGYAVLNRAFDDEFVRSLWQALQQQKPEAFKPAGIGRQQDFHTNQEIRSDHIMWLDENMSGCQAYFVWSETLRFKLNEMFYLGLFAYECMFAHYPSGAAYQKHVDAFSNQRMPGGNRKISTVLYLNPDWQPADGGELLLYNHGQDQPCERIAPEWGTLVVFLSEDFPHEVLPAQKSRFSLTGWFRINN